MALGLSGVQIQAAVKKSTTWGTPVVCGANDGMLALPGTMDRKADILIDDSLGAYWPVDGIQDGIKMEGTKPCYLRYDGTSQLMLAMFMGISPTPGTGGATGAYLHTMDWGTHTNGIFATFCELMGDYVEECPSLKVEGFTLTAETGKPVHMSFDCIGITNNFSSTTNTTTTMASVTYYEPLNRAAFAQSDFRINTQSGTALGTANKIYPSKVVLKAKRPLTRTMSCKYKDTTGTVQELIEEPSGDGKPTIELEVTLPRHTDTAWHTILDADTRQKAELAFTGSIIASAVARKITFQFPHLQLKDNEIVAISGNIEEPLTFLAHGCSTAPTGMTGVLWPFRVLAINRRATAYL